MWLSGFFALDRQGGIGRKCGEGIEIRLSLPALLLGAGGAELANGRGREAESMFN